MAVEDRDLWNLVQAIQDSEVKHFGCYSLGRDELKGTKLLKRKTYRLASQLPPIPQEERSILARQCLEGGSAAGKRQITALAQSKLAYISNVLDICARFRCKAFASIVSPDAPTLASTDYLRKDYSYLFEHFYYFLEDTNPTASAIVVFESSKRAGATFCSGRWIATSSTHTTDDGDLDRSSPSRSSYTVT